MKYKHIISFIIIIAIAITTLVVPVAATNTGAAVSGLAQNVDYFIASLMDYVSSGYNLAGSFFEGVAYVLDNAATNVYQSFVDFCSSGISFIEAKSDVSETYNIRNGNGDTAIVNTADISNAYDDYVDTLPLPYVSSSGALSYYPGSWYKVSGNGACYPVTGYMHYHCDSSNTSGYDNFTCYASINSGQPITLPAGTYKIVTDQYKETYSGTGRTNFSRFDATYGPKVGVYLSNNNLTVNCTTSIYYSREKTFTLYSRQTFDTLRFSFHNETYIGNNGVHDDKLYCHFEVVSLNEPYTGYESARPDNLPINLADDNNISNVYDNCVIINEGDGIYYNPSTDTSEEIKNWNYDYRTRTYNITTNSGTNVSVTYGNDNLIVNEGNTTYTYYYVIQQGQDCQHEFMGDPENPPIYPTCTTAGMVNYVCSICGQTRFDIIPALEHDWKYIETVQAEYDENEELINDAFELYRCSRCGEEKQVEVSETPQNSTDTESWKNWNWLKQWMNEFRTWLGARFDAVISAIGAGGGGGGGSTEVNNVTVNNNTVYITGSDGEEQEIDIPGIIARFGWFRQVWAIGTYFVQQVGTYEQAAYDYDAELMDGREGGFGGSANNSNAPSIKINLADAQSVYGYDYGGEVELLDLSWYTPYKQTVDNLISGFLWLAFIWALFRHAPGIISGAGLTSNRVDDLEQGFTVDWRKRVR